MGMLDLLLRRPRAVLACTVIACLGIGSFAVTVRLDNDFAKLFATDSPEAAFREAFREVFGADDALLIAALATDRPEDPAFVELVARLSREAARDPDVTRVYSATEASIVWVDETSGDIRVDVPFGPRSPLEAPFADRLARVMTSSLGGPRLLSPEGDVFLVVSQLDAELDTYEKIVEPAARFRTRIERGIATSGLDIELFFAGIPFTRIAAIGAMQGDLLRLTPLTTVVLALLLLAYLRRVSGVVVVLSALSLACIATGGVIGMAGDDLNQLTITFPILLMVVSVAGAVHLLIRYRRERMSEANHTVAVRRTIVSVTRANALTSLTTAIGFLSLAAADMQVLHGYGRYLACGVGFAFVAVTGGVGSCLVLFGDRLVRIPRVEIDGRNARSKSAFTRVLTRPRCAGAVCALGFALLALLGLDARGIAYDYRLSDNVPRGDALEEGNRLIDSRLAGIVPLEVSFAGSPGDFRDPALLERIDAVAVFMREQLGIVSPVSLAGIVKELHRGFTGVPSIPRDRAAIEQLLLVAASSPDRIVDQLVTFDASHTRLRATTHDGGGRYIGDIQRRVESFARDRFAGTGVEVRVTGEAPVAYAGMNALSRELMESVALALAVVLCVIALAFRSARIALTAVLPNVLPIALGLFAYGLTAPAIDPLPGVALCLAIGIVVDDSVHILARYEEERSAGRPKADAIVRAVVETRQALVASTVALATGFGMLLFSTVDLNQSLGALGALTILLALVCDLVFMPAMMTLLGDP